MESDSTDDRTTLAFDWFIEQQCLFCEYAYEDLKRDLSLTGGNQDRAWYSVQGILVAAANLSKIFWPSEKRKNGKFVERGMHLRKRFDVQDESPLATQDVRHAFEHFDERFQEWLEANPDTGFSDSGVYYGSGHRVDATHRLRTMSANNLRITFLTDSFEILPAMKEIRRLLPLVRKDAEEIMRSGRAARRVPPPAVSPRSG